MGSKNSGRSELNICSINKNEIIGLTSFGIVSCPLVMTFVYLVVKNKSINHKGSQSSALRYTKGYYITLFVPV